MEESDILLDMFNSQLNEYPKETKIKVDILHEVFDAWIGAAPKTLEEEKIDSILFWYDHKRWKGSISHERSLYFDKLVSFINIKLPYDNYFRDSKKSLQTDEIYSLIEHVQDILIDFFPSYLKSIQIHTNYALFNNRLILYFWNFEETKCIRVKFKYGYNEGTAYMSKGKFRRVENIQTI